jgi:hypothetical protein
MMLFFIQGVTAQYFFPGKPDSPQLLGFALPGSLLIFLWYHADSSAREYKRSLWLNMCVIAITMFALPYYFFRSRGLKKGLITTALMLALCVPCILLEDLGAYAMRHIA